ncbi:hypothetical protein [Nitrospina gracilis]|uniref:hypothetical protein n=1 Tax=Nitrospina gracilis TaxID=35801 RepID=UPI001F1DCBC2|nr:hypothetical protein [Nitrospina gracilis]MCF8720299.1 hypothetical protein [Nitrospina gracilis Nb-211]
MMTPFQARKAALVFAVFAFIILSIGSWVSGARVWAAVLRGIEGFLLFGAFAWAVCSLLATSEPQDKKKKRKNSKKGQNLDQTV